MSNVIRGRTFYIGVPVETLKIIGEIEENEQLKNFVEEVFMNLKYDVTNEDKEKIVDIIPYISNIIFLPDILNVMIQSDVLFEDAIKASTNIIQERCLEYQSYLEEMEENEDANNVMLAFLKEIIQIGAEVILGSEDAIIRLQFVNISSELSFYIAYTGLTAIIVDILKAVRPTLEKLLEPIREKMVEYIDEVKEKSKIDDEKSKILIEYVDTIIESNYNNVPTQSVLTQIINKSISENITFTMAKNRFKSDLFIENFIENIEKHNVFNQILISFEEILDNN